MRFETRSILTVIGWWAGLSCWPRYGAAGLFLLVPIVILLLNGRLWVWGWVVGLVLLIFGGPSDSEKKGYNF